MSKTQDQTYLIYEQYKNATNLRARIELHERFSTNKADFSRWVFDHIQAPENARVLELGTGPANFWLKNAERIPVNWRISVSDLSPGMVEEAKQATVSLNANFDCQVLDAQAIAFDDDSFDVVMANHMLYHVPDIDKAIAEIRRVLKPEGRFYAATNGSAHMQELDDFVVKQLTGKLEGVDFGLMNGLKFRLENGREILAKQFTSINRRDFVCDLEVTEAEPFMAYIMSMQRLNSEIGHVDQAELTKVLQNANKVLDQQLKEGPIHVTKSTGLFEAF